jgi:two-component system, sporulation sensor kinase E
MLREFLNIARRYGYRSYVNEIIFSLLLSITIFSAVRVIAFSQENTLKTDLLLQATLLKEAINTDIQVNFLLNDNIGFEEVHSRVFNNTDGIIDISFYSPSKELIWSKEGQNQSKRLLEDPRNKDYTELDDRILLSFEVFDNTDESLGFIQFDCSTTNIVSEINGIQFQFLALSIILIVLLTGLAIWSRLKFLSFSDNQALSQARLEMTQDQYSQLETENKVLEITSGQRDLSQIGEDLVKYIGAYLKVQRIVLFRVLDKDLIKIASLKDINLNDSAPPTPLKLSFGEGISGSVALSQKARIVTDTTKESDYLIDGEQMLSEIAVPIILEGELIGVLDAEHQNKDYFTQSHLEFLIKISNLLALSLKNAISRIEIQNRDAAILSAAERLENIIENIPRGIAFEDVNQHIAHLNQKFIDLIGLEANPEDIIGLHCDQARSMLSKVFPESERFAERTIEILERREVVTDDTLTLLDGRSVTRHYAPVYQNGEFIGNLWAYADNTIETRFYENLNYEREKYINIIANMEIGLLEVDNDDRIITANNAFLKMTNYSEEELIGKIGHEILVTEKEAKRIKQMNARRLDGESSIYEIEYLTKNKEVRHMLVSGGPNRDIKGDIIGSIGIHLDISKLKELENLREELIKDLTESNDELSNYAHVVSHDLKTPLRSISAAMNWLKEDNQDKLDEMSLSYLEIVDESLIKMDKIISDTLRYSELKQKSGVDSEVDLNHMIGHLIKELNKSYPETEIQIKGELPVLTINETKAIQIFQNILDNACKYRDPNRDSKIEIRCLNIFGFFEFQIEDNGIGIEKKHESRVFEIFQKLNNNQESNGVGMSIVKKIIDNYGGKIWFESEVGQGTTFKFNLPRSMRSATLV